MTSNSQQIKFTSSEDYNSGTQGTYEKLILIAVNSTVIYIISFIFFFVLYHLTTSITAYNNDLSAKLMYYGTDISVGRYEWSKTRVVYTYAMGPLVCFFAAIICRYFYIAYYRKRRGFVKLLLTWGFIHGLLFSFGNVITGIITGRGVGNAFKWAYAGQAIQYGAAGFSLLVLILLGFAMTRAFLATSPSQTLIENGFNNRPLYVLFAAVIPWFVSSLLMFLIQYPKQFSANMLIMIMMVPILLPTLSFSAVNMRVTLSKSKDQVNLGWPYIILCAIVVIGYRIILEFGITFKDVL
ncbi:MAG: hypothetical protein V4543_08705 [Bacteroidota bacterium]